MGVSINDGTVDTRTTTITMVGGDGDFALGYIDLGATVYFDGRLDEVSFWKRLHTAAERTALYNNGNGLRYPFGVTNRASEYWVEDAPGASWAHPPDGFQDWQKPGVLPFLEVGGDFESLSLIIADGT